MRFIIMANLSLNMYHMIQIDSKSSEAIRQHFDHRATVGPATPATGAYAITLVISVLAYNLCLVYFTTCGDLIQ